MRSATFLTAALAVSLVTAGCSTISVCTDYDRTVDFSVYKTFDIVHQQEMRNDLIRGRIDGAITRQLEVKGFTPSTAQPDLLVAVHAKLSRETHFDTTTFGYGWGAGWGYWGRRGAGGATTVVRQVPVGTVIIDVVDARQKKLIWQAVASDTLDPRASADERDRRVNDAMEKIFAGFPPRAK